MIQKEEPILVDFGSAYIQGSKTRKSGTRHRDSELHGINREIKGDIICLGYTLEEISANLPKELCIFAKKAKETREDSFWKIGDCLKYLKKLFVRRCLQVLVCLLAGILLVLCSKSCVAEFRSRSKDGEYERDFRLCEEATSQKKELLLELINRYPEKWEGYLEFLDTLLEDRMLTAEEYLSFLEIYNNWEEKLLLDLNGYAEVVYQTGLCCWYFYQGRENTRLAMEWFRKLQGYPEELKKKSDVYLALGEFQDKADLFQKTGEHHGEYLDYFEQCETLKGSEEVYFQLMFYKEEILFLVHYMAELRMEGLTRERMRVFLDEMKKELEFISDQRSNIVELKQEVEGVMRILEETTRQIYEE